MATTNTGQPISLGNGNQLAAIAELLPVLFGSSNKQVSNPGDTSALQQLLGQLQGADYSGTLQAIFQQAAGQIPGLQGAFSNAVGARSGNNSAVQAALSQLLQQTTLAGQKQVADQQLQNQQLQAQAGGAIAQATKGTNVKQSTGGVAPQLTGILGLIQAAKMATGAKDLDELGKKFGFGKNASPSAGTNPVTGPAGPIAAVTGAAPVTGATPQATPIPGGFDINNMLGGGAGISASVPPGGYDPLDFSLPNDLFIGGMSRAPDQSGFNLSEQLGGGMSTNPNAPGFDMGWFDPAPVEDYGFGGGVDEFWF